MLSQKIIIAKQNGRKGGRPKGSTAIYGQKTCNPCGKIFRPKSSTQYSCSDECKKKAINKKDQGIINKYADVNSRQAKKEFLKSVKNKKYKITEAKLLEPYDSPTGMAYIGVNKRPLQTVQNGYGFKGVLIQTDNRTLVQCHVCGKWVKKISGSHLKKHKMTKEQYIEKFDLKYNNSLVADETSYKYEKAGHKRVAKYKENNINLKTTQKLATENSKNRHKYSVEMQNKYGTCEKQLGFRLLQFVRQYQFLPSRSTKGEGGRICKVLHKRYNGLNKGFKHYGLPSLYRQGTNAELCAPNGKQFFFNYNKNYDRRIVYGWIMENCEALKTENIIKFAQ